MVELEPDREAAANQPALALELEPDGVWCVSARGLRPELIPTLGGRRSELLLRVRVAEAGTDEDVPNVIGDRESLEDGLRFIPRYPFEPGVPFRAILDLRVLGRSGFAELQTLDFSIPSQGGAGGTVVKEVFPSSNVLPENLLRFYVRFSKPMRRGGPERDIEMLGPDGSPASDVLYRAPVELWDGSMTCLTVLLDPGRLKREVGPNRMLGPPLKSGQRYTLAIGPGMIDVDGCPLRESFRKSFRVSDAVREPIAVERWRIRVPKEGTLEPLVLEFPRPLDWAQLWRGITVASGSGEPIRGQVDIDRGETRSRFAPDAPWLAGAYTALVSPDLEDVCGNTAYGPFDGPLRSADEVARKTGIYSIPFVVNGRPEVESARPPGCGVISAAASSRRNATASRSGANGLTPADWEKASATSARRIP
jgi:hypothetical protein